MKLLIYGDLHTEVQGFQPKQEWLNGADVVIQAGDLNYGQKSITWLKTLNKKVFFVPGNHEYWNPAKRVPFGESMYFTGLPQYKVDFQHSAHEVDQIFDNFQDPSVSILRNKIEIYQNIRFLGTTLWFDAVKNEQVAHSMHDFDRIFIKRGIKWSIAEVQRRHEEAVSFLEQAINTPFDGKTVVVTHHAPSPKSTFGNGEGYDDNIYSTNLEHLMGREKVALWVHGHVHRFNDYQINDTRIISNPRGHPSEKVRNDFRKNFVVEL